VALRELAWGQYKMGIDRWFYWESTYYNNYQGNTGQTNVFSTAQTFGNLDEVDPVLGETGWNYLNGDGVLLYPGTDTRYPEDSYGVMGPFASLRLKHWRRGIQDVDYLTLAAEIDPERTAEIVNEMVPKVLWEYGVSDPEDPTWVLTDISWSTDPDVWEAARAELADIIESAASTSQVVPPTVTASSDRPTSEARLADVSHWFYMINVNLEPEMVERIAASEYDMVVLDFIPSEETTPTTPWPTWWRACTIPLIPNWSSPTLTSARRRSIAPIGNPAGASATRSGSSALTPTAGRATSRWPTGTTSGARSGWAKTAICRPSSTPVSTASTWIGWRPTPTRT
ncbi:MAG: DUF4091 domain-containing protein, partial [Anaerolineae bacterium]|nr:DUF4091 domain-containing protein [Anaerolineae bacterium]